MLKKLSEKIGLTQTEIRVVLFLLIMPILGLGYKFYRSSNNPGSITKFDYSKQDSLFNSAQKKEINDKKKRDLAHKIVDSKQEVLDFNTTNFERNKAKKELAEKSINLNKAGIKELENLPGIGEVTAEKIIKMRKNLDGFKKVKELLKVKGIGNIKLNKIKKYLYID